MSVKFLIIISNAPTKLMKSVVFKQKFDAGIEKLLDDYHTDNDREGAEIRWGFLKRPKGTKVKKIEVIFLKEEGQVVFDDLEKKLMSEIASLLEELVNGQGKDKYLVEELS